MPMHWSCCRRCRWPGAAPGRRWLLRRRRTADAVRPDRLRLRAVAARAGIAYYTVMERCSTRKRVVLSPMLLAGCIQSQTLPGHTEPYDFFVNMLVFVAAGHGRRPQPHPPGLPARGRSEGRAGRGRARPAGRAGGGAGAHQDREGATRRRRPPRQPDGRAIGSGRGPAAGPAAEASKSVEIIGTTAREALTELRRLLGVLRGRPVPDGRGQTAPAPSISGARRGARAGPPGRDRRGHADRGHPGR